MTIESDIAAWALTRPPWQQDVLLDLATGNPLDSKSISRLVDEILSGARQRVSKPADGSLQIKSSDEGQVSLVSITNLRGVNALVEGQRLELASIGLTVIYGNNGSGKSGYARLIKAMVSARHRADVLPNVFRETATLPGGSLHYKVAGHSYQHDFPDAPPAELLKMSFYDEHCGDEYLTKGSTISYRPSALTLLDGLIRVCDEVRAEFDARITTNEKDALLLELNPETKAHSFFQSMSAATSIDGLGEAVEVPPGTVERLGMLLQEEARLNATDPRHEKERLEVLARQIGFLGQELHSLSEALGSDRARSRDKLRQKATSSREAASIAAADTFENDPLPGVGSETWRTLWEAARNYSLAEAYPTHDFPHTSGGAVCALCQQALDDPAKARLMRFDKYMKDTTESDARSALDKLVASIEELDALDFSRPALLQALNSYDPRLGAETTQLLTTLKEHRDASVLYLWDFEETPTPLPEVDTVEKLVAEAEALRERARRTDIPQFHADLKSIREEKTELQAQLRLAESSNKLAGEVKRMKRLETLKTGRASTDTKSITLKISALTREYANDRVLEQFVRETTGMRLTRVTLQNLGARKGQINQKPSLVGAHKGVAARSVLSEGEQSALGLAGFFTEAELDPTKSAIIFDDPVTSMDHVRRDKVADRLSRLAKQRQVVVFTHDVSFTGDLTAAADRHGVPLSERSIELRGAEPGVCTNSFPWNSKDFGLRIEHLTKELARLKRDRLRLQQRDWEEHVALWAGYLSETWERSVTTEVLNRVFDRGQSQVRMKQFRLLASITEDDDKDLQTGYGMTSTWSRRHDNSPVTNYVAPEPDELEIELKRISNWRRRIKKYVD